jgi:hypothetical protein
MLIGSSLADALNRMVRRRLLPALAPATFKHSIVITAPIRLEQINLSTFSVAASDAIFLIRREAVEQPGAAGALKSVLAAVARRV